MANNRLWWPLLLLVVITPVNCQLPTQWTNNTAAASGGGSDFEKAQQCERSSRAWSTASSSWNESRFIKTIIVTSTSTVEKYFGDAIQGNYYTLCDGIPRISPGYNTTGSATFALTNSFDTTISISATLTRSDKLPRYPIPTPSCKIGPTECYQLQESWSQSVFATEFDQNY